MEEEEMIPFLMMEEKVLRPLNYPPGTPAQGIQFLNKNGKTLCVSTLRAGSL
jgi:calcineurin-like phosphoesterase